MTRQLPAFHDPFAGGGAIPTEAQRLGLEAFATDLNPVAVLLNKAMIELPPEFHNASPVCSHLNGDTRLIEKSWCRAPGLEADIRYYGKSVEATCKERLSDVYPAIEITEDVVSDRQDLKPYLGQKRVVTAYITARTVRSPNPAFNHVYVPLIKTFVLSSKAGKEVFLNPVVDGEGYRLVHPGLSWVEIESTAVEVDGRLEVFAISVAADSALDRHDLAVYSFGHGVGDSVSAVADHVGQSLLDRPCHLLQRSQFRVDHSAIPVLEKDSRRPLAVVMPEVAKHLLVGPGFAVFVPVCRLRRSVPAAVR